MVALRFDRLSRCISERPSRRGLLAGTIALGFAARLAATADAKKRKRKKKQKPLPRNAFGCVNVGKPCKGKDANCCSNICQGRKPKKGGKDKRKCVAHNSGGCTADQDFCVPGAGATCGTAGFCVRTTGNASFCGGLGACVVCRADADCEPAFGSGAACVICPTSCPASPQTACLPAAT